MKHTSRRQCLSLEGSGKHKTRAVSQPCRQWQTQGGVLVGKVVETQGKGNVFTTVLLAVVVERSEVPLAEDLRLVALPGRPNRAENTPTVRLNRRHVGKVDRVGCLFGAARGPSMLLCLAKMSRQGVCG